MGLIVKKHILLVAGVFFCVFAANPMLAQKIDSVYFAPPDPEPGSVLGLNISLLGTKSDDVKITIRLTTWTDLDNDCTYGSDGEEIKRPPLTVQDNEPGVDKDDEPGEILVDIFKVPTTKIPRRYAVKILTDTDSVEDSIHVIKGTLRCSESSRLGLSALIRKYISRDRAKNETKINRLWVYYLTDQPPQEILHYREGNLRNPQISMNNEKIIFTAIGPEGNRIGWAPIIPGNLKWITTGPNDDYAYWLPPGERLIFLRGNSLFAADLLSGETWPISTDLEIEKIIGVRKRTAGDFGILVEMPVLKDSDRIKLRMLILDSNLEPQGTIPLVNDPIWYHQHVIDPERGRYVMVDDNQQLFIQELGGKQVAIRSSESETEYFDPSWSPTKNIIVFLSGGS